MNNGKLHSDVQFENSKLLIFSHLNRKLKNLVHKEKQLHYLMIIFYLNLYRYQISLYGNQLYTIINHQSNYKTSSLRFITGNLMDIRISKYVLDYDNIMINCYSFEKRTRRNYEYFLSAI